MFVRTHDNFMPPLVWTLPYSYYVLMFLSVTGTFLYFLCSGYAAQPYELLQAPFKSRPSSITTDPYKKEKEIVSTGPSDSISGEVCKITIDEPPIQFSVDNQTSLSAQDPSSNGLLHAKSFGSFGAPSSNSQRTLPELSKQETHSLVLSNKSQESASKSDDFLSGLVVPHKSHAKEGKGTFNDLYLPPLILPDMSQILASGPSKTPIPMNSSNGSILGNCMDALGSVLEEETASSSQDSKSSEVTLSVADLTMKQKTLGSPGHPLTTSNSRKKLHGQDSATKMRRIGSKIMELSKEKLLQATREKNCPTGMHDIVPLASYQ